MANENRLPENLLLTQRLHLANLLEAIQRCVYFLDASDRSIAWPLTDQFLKQHQKDNDLFEALAAVNERFAKLQDTLGAAMRHSLILAGEQADSFLKVLAIFEKFGVVSSIEDWQVARTARNLAAHDYETDYARVAEHFNTLHALKTGLIASAGRFVEYAATALGVSPKTDCFAEEFNSILLASTHISDD